jgi:hypothetical protein
MALDKLGIYNDALTLVGERRLELITDERKPRYDLDAIYDLGAVGYCLEIVKPAFSRIVVKLNTPTTTTTHDLTQVHTLPTGFVTMIGVFSDSGLDQQVDRFVRQGDTILCEYDTVYLHYVTNTYDISIWDASFARVVSAYLAREYSNQSVPKKAGELSNLFNERIEGAIALAEDSTNDTRSRATNGTLSNDWIKIYNDALLILGLGASKITSGSMDHPYRSVLDSAVDAGLVEDILEDTGWFWAIKTARISADPSIDPDWGYEYGFQEPDDMERFDGVWSDEYMRYPIKMYAHESNVIYCGNSDYIYIKYVSSDFKNQPSTWPSKFKRLVAAKLAKDVAPSIPNADINHANNTYQERENETKAADTQQSPPQLITEGTWVRGRFAGNRDRNRP